MRFIVVIGVALWALGCAPRCDRTVHTVVVPDRVADDIWAGPSGDVYVVGERGWTTHGFAVVPSSVSTDLRRVWAAGPTDVYAVDELGRILHSCGQCPWTIETNETSLTVEAIFGSDATHLFAIQPAALLTSAGDGNWTKMPLGFQAPLDVVWASGADDVYAAGSLDVIAHRRAGAWQIERQGGDSETWRAIWGSGPGDVYVVGEAVAGGAIARSAGGGVWHEQILAELPLQAIAGSSAADVWAGGVGYGDRACVLLHSTGADDWTLVDVPHCEDGIARLAVTDGSHLFALETNGHIDVLVDGRWTRLDASERGISYDTDQSAAQALDGTCDWPTR